MDVQKITLQVTLTKRDFQHEMAKSVPWVQEERIFFSEILSRLPEVPHPQILLEKRSIFDNVTNGNALGRS